ncbi:MAG TPA: DsbA family protein [Solirubrobacteraceae bacterium]|nr:DsbA family protein [Solirubrobacteraceae bacterium]
MSPPPCLYLDLASAESYLTAERILGVMPVAVEWVPVRARDLAHAVAPEGLRCAEEETIWRDELERTARERGLQPVRWPPAVPFDSDAVLRAATFAKSIGKGVAFTQAAFRQAYAGGGDLTSPDTIVIAAAACEMHPRAVLAALEQRSVAAALDRATAQARERGVLSVPAVWTPAGEGGPARVFHADEQLEAAAAHLGEHAPR